MKDLLDTRDVDLARAQVARTYCPHQIRLRGDGSGFRARHSEACSSDISVFRLGYGSERVDVHPVPFGDFVLISRPVTGALRVRSRGEDVVVPAGKAVALDPVNPHHLQFGPECRILTIKLSRSALADAAGPSGFDAVRRAIRTGSPSDASAWDAVTRFLLSEALPHGLLDEGSAMRSHIVQLVAAAALTSFGTREDAHTGAGASRGSASFRRALDFIQAEARRDIGLLDIAAAAGLSGRALQDAFRRHLGTTPLAHLRTVRLREARRELRADPDRTISDVAHSWGFGNLGRFASDYQRAFGRLPSEERRRTGPDA